MGHQQKAWVKMYLKLSTNCISKNNNEINKMISTQMINHEQTALITGATSGIGKATAEILAKTIIKLSFAVT
jgi:NADPH:quinone reductase-like Zn-dependent oxidoreductase